MPRPVRVFHMDAGDCGACAGEVWAAVEGSAELCWAATPQSADIVVLTGSIPATVRNAVQSLYSSLIQDRLPLVAVGRCAIDGHPFGKGGVAGLSELTVQRKVDGCPPLVDVVTETLIQAARQPRVEES